MSTNSWKQTLIESLKYNKEDFLDNNVKIEDDILSQHVLRYFSDNNKDSSEFDLNPSVTEENVLGWLRLDWRGGSEHDLDELVKSQGYPELQARQLRVKWLAEGLLKMHDGRVSWAEEAVSDGSG